MTTENRTASRRLGKSGIEVSPMGMGCWAIGGPWSFNGTAGGWSQVDDAESLRALRRAFDLGARFFDTAANYGAGHSERVKKTFKLLLAVCLTYSFLLWGFIELFPQGFARMFSSDAALIGFTAHALRIYCAVLCLFGIQMSCQMAFVSIGSALCSISVAVVRKFVLLLPLIYIMPAFVADKTMGVYMAEPVADVIAITFTSILFTIQFGKAMKKLEAQKKGEAK